MSANSCGAPSSSARSGSTTISSGSMSTSTSSAASTAAPRLSATTTAIASPWKRTTSRASVGRSMSSGAIGPGGNGARPRSAPVKTPATPGAAAAAAVSMPSDPAVRDLGAHEVRVERAGGVDVVGVGPRPLDEGRVLAAADRRAVLPIDRCIRARHGRQATAGPVSVEGSLIRPERSRHGGRRHHRAAPAPGPADRRRHVRRSRRARRAHRHRAPAGGLRSLPARQGPGRAARRAPAGGGRDGRGLRRRPARPDARQRRGRARRRCATTRPTAWWRSAAAARWTRPRRPRWPSPTRATCATTRATTRSRARASRSSRSRRRPGPAARSRAWRSSPTPSAT